MGGDTSETTLVAMKPSRRAWVLLKDPASEDHGAPGAVQGHGHYDHPFSGRPAGDGLPAASPAPRLADDDQRQQGVFGSARRIDPDAIGRILDRLQALEDGFDPTQGIVTVYRPMLTILEQGGQAVCSGLRPHSAGSGVAGTRRRGPAIGRRVQVRRTFQNKTKPSNMPVMSGR
jgi:hypothetical protein